MGKTDSSGWDSPGDLGKDVEHLVAVDIHEVVACEEVAQREVLFLRRKVGRGGSWLDAPLDLR